MQLAIFKSTACPRHILKTWFLVALAALYAVFPYLFKQIEFNDRDIVYNYAPIRSWFAEQIRGGVFPLWDPFIGLGRFAEVWTSIPVDILSLLEIPLELSYRTIYSIQIILIFVSLRYVFARLNWGPLNSTLLTLLYLLSPATSYFLRYYIKGWAFLLYGMLFTFMYLYVVEQRRSHLVWISLSTLVLTLGCKFEYVFTLALTIIPAYTAYVLLEAKGREKAHTLWAGLIAFVSPLLINYWNFNLIINAAQSTSRLVNSPISWPAFLKSLSYGFIDPNFMGLLFISLILFWPQKPLPMRSLLIILFSVFGIVFFSLENPISGYSMGILIPLCLYLWRARHDDAGDWGILLAKAAFLLFYFARKSPGEVDEIRIIQRHVFTVEFGLATLCSVGLFNRNVTRLFKWPLILIGTVLFYRSVGLTFLNYLGGILWIPGRDNFLIELPLAVFSTYGWSILISHARPWWNRREYSVALTLVVLFLISHPFLEKPIKNKIEVWPPTFEWEWIKDLRTDKINRDVYDWKRGFDFEPFGQVRILSFFHSFGRKFGIADTYEYQSLASGRYSKYSISSRLGVNMEEAPAVGSITGAVSEKYLRLLRPMQKVEIFENNPLLKLHFLMFYVVSSVPKLDCNHLKLFGIRYIEADSGGYPWQGGNAGALNWLYSLQSSITGDGLFSDVAEKIRRCNFDEIQVGQRRFWAVPNPLSRAFFLPGIKSKDLVNLTPDDVKVMGENISIRGKSVKWSPVTINNYQPNRVEMTASVPVPGAVVLSDLYHEQWSVTVDNRRSELHPAFFLLRSVDIEPGNVQIQFQISYPNKIRVIVFMFLGFIGLAFVFLKRKPN